MENTSSSVAEGVRDIVIVRDIADEDGGPIRRQLFEDVMRRNWSRVLETYGTKRIARTLSITQEEDTVLHLAVLEGGMDVLQKLVKIIQVNHPGDSAKGIIGMQNKSGNTPLHLAAALGMRKACELLASRCPSLIVEARNTKGETPLFVAAHFGKKKAFYALQDEVHKSRPSTKDGLPYSRRNDGNTILHITILREHFDLALEIIHLYPNLVYYNNVKGKSPLYVLAKKPRAFKSGHRIPRFDKLIYSCIAMDPFKPKYQQEKKRKENHINEQLEKNKSELPHNYKVCLDLLRMLGNAFSQMATCFQGSPWRNCCIDEDEEIPRKSLQRTITEGDQFAGQSNYANQSETEKAYQSRPQHPKYHMTCLNFIKIAMKPLFIILGFGDQFAGQSNYANQSETDKAYQSRPQLLKNLKTCLNFIKIAMEHLFMIRKVGGIKEVKRRNILAYQIMNELVGRTSSWRYEQHGKKPHEEDTGLELPQMEDSSIKSADPSRSASSQKKEEPMGKPKEDSVSDTPILIAARMGILELVKKILEAFPTAIQDLDSKQKNIVLLAVEFRQPHVYEYLVDRKIMKGSIFGLVDSEGNSALHLSTLPGQRRPWVVPGEALQLQCEIKWYKYIEDSMEPGFFERYNSAGKTAWEIFTEGNKELVKNGGKWLSETSQSCSVVATLIATVAFTSATAVPGGLNQYSGFPMLEGWPAFNVFAVAAFVASCFSVASLIMFLSIINSRYQKMDFEWDLPLKLILGLTFLFLSIAAMLVSFCAGHFFVIGETLKVHAYPIYAIIIIPILLFAMVQFPLYMDLIDTTIARVPERSYKLKTR